VRELSVHLASSEETGDDIVIIIGIEALVEVIFLDEAAAHHLLPFYGCWRLTRDIVNNAVDATHFIDDAVGNLAQQFIG
jgi:hypothetical protein